MADGSEYVKDLYSKGVQEIREELRNYWLNHSFLLGYQWTYWEANTGGIDNVASEGDRIQATVNRTRANMRVIMANLTQRELSFENLPSSFDDATIKAAKLGEAVVEDLRKTHQWESLREKHLTALVKGGTAAISVDWDAANETTVETVLPLGDFTIEPGHTGDGSRARYWIRKQALPQDQVYSMFEECFPDGPPAVSSTTSLDPYMHRVVGDSNGNGTNTIKRTAVYTYYERPNPLNPDGVVLVEVDGKIVQHVEKWPFPFKDRLNIAVGTETTIENRWYGASFLDDVRPIQVALNATWSNLLEHLRDAGTARLVVPSSAVDYINTISDLPGEILEYLDGSAAPDYLTPAQLTSWIRDMPGMLSGIIDDLMGVHDVSRGQAPPNIESGLGLSILAENDSSPVGRLIKETVRIWNEVAQMSLALHEVMVEKPRQAVVADGVSRISMPWKGADLGGQIMVEIPLEAVIPVSRASQVARADKMMQMGLIQDAIQYASIANLPGKESIIDAINPDVAKARRENAGFVSGEISLPAGFDDHRAHIKTHNDFRKTQRFELMDLESKEDLNAHCLAHETMSSEEAARAQAQHETAPALGQAPNASGSEVDPALLEAGMPMPPGEQGPAPAPAAAPPMDADNPLVNPDIMADMMLQSMENPE